MIDSLLYHTFFFFQFQFFQFLFFFIIISLFFIFITLFFSLIIFVFHHFFSNQVVFAGSNQEVQVLVAASHLAVERKDFDTAIRMLGTYVHLLSKTKLRLLLLLLFIFLFYYYYFYLCIHMLFNSLMYLFVTAYFTCLYV